MRKEHCTDSTDYWTTIIGCGILQESEMTNTSQGDKDNEQTRTYQ